MQEILLSFDEYANLCPGSGYGEMESEEESAFGDYLKSNKEICRYAPKSTIQYKDFPRKYYLMDGTEREIYEKNVEEGKREPYEKKFWDYAYFLKLKILDIYKGTKYDDTCISEIKN